MPQLDAKVRQQLVLEVVALLKQLNEEDLQTMWAEIIATLHKDTVTIGNHRYKIIVSNLAQVES